MFERLMQQAEERARQEAGQRREAIAQRLAADAPPDVAIAVETDRIVFSGRGLRRRLALDPVLRWLFVGAGR